MGQVTLCPIRLPSTSFCTRARSPGYFSLQTWLIVVRDRPSFSATTANELAPTSACNTSSHVSMLIPLHQERIKLLLVLIPTTIGPTDRGMATGISDQLEPPC
ncbi:hypothetical protein D3C86_1420040 [compost metagenome]